MGKLYLKNRTPDDGGEVTDKTIVDILTTNEVRTSVWAQIKPGRLISDIIGINSVCQGKPIGIGNGFYERGLVDPEAEDTLYLINAERKVLGMMPNNLNLFYDQDKVWDENRYTWEGTFQDILHEFEKVGYSIEEV